VLYWVCVADTHLLDRLASHFAYHALFAKEYEDLNSLEH